MPKKLKLSDQIRNAIKTCGKSRYRIWKETGIDQALLSHFLHRKRSLSLNTVDRLAECIGLEGHVRGTKGR